MSAERCDMTLLLQAEFDGELDAAEAASLAEHRSLCPICRANWAELERVRETVRVNAPYHRASPALRQAVTAAVAPRTPAARRALPWWREGLGFALGAALAASLLLALWPAGAPGLVDAVVDDHVRALEPGHLTDVLSSDSHTVKPWFDGRLDFAPPVKNLAAQGFPLLGGRLDYLAGRPVAALAYGRRRHVIDLFVWPQKGGDAAPESAVRHGYNLVRWRQGGMALWAVSDLEGGELRRFVRIWRSEAR